MTLCLLLAGFAGGDPLLPVEAVAGSAIVAWTLQVVREIAAAWQVERTLGAEATPVVIGDVACWLTPALGTDAVVIGALRPRIFVGLALVRTLSDDELEAVLYHEDHHRRTLAPLRAAALAGWLRLFGRAGSVRDALHDRLADLETLADAEALRRGSSPVSLARALLKGGEPIGLPVAFSYAADRRVERLLSQVASDPAADSRRPPYEWLPVVMFAVAALACHVCLWAV